MEDQKKDLTLVKQDLVAISAARPDFMDGDAIIKLFEKRSNLMKRIRAVALKSTTPADWLDFSGKPYLQASGAEKVRQELGLNVRIINSTHTKMEDEKGKYDMFSHVLEVSHPALGAVEVIGKKSTRNKFFATKTEWHQGEDGKKTKTIIDREQWTISKEDVDKAAYSNAMQRAITEFCGLRNLTWEQIREIVGEHVETQAAGVTFGTQKGGVAGEGKSDKAKFEPASPEKLVAVREEIKDSVLKLCSDDPERARALLIKVFRTDDLNRLSEKQTFWFIGQLRKGLVKESE